MKRKILAGVLCLGCLTVTSWYLSDPDPVTIARELARLAPLPPSAEVVHQGSTGNLFSRSAYAVIRIPPADLERWLQDSAGTRGLEPTYFSLSRPLRSFALREKSPPGEMEIVTIPVPFPWFSPHIRKGRKLVVPQDRQACSGVLYIDDEDHIVYLMGSRS